MPHENLIPRALTKWVVGLGLVYFLGLMLFVWKACGRWTDIATAYGTAVAGLGGLGVGLALWLQWQQIAAQREDLAAQRAQLQEQAHAAEQERTVNTFFRLLAMHGQVCESVQYSPTVNYQDIRRGRRVLAELEDEVAGRVLELRRAAQKAQKPGTDERAYCTEAFRELLDAPHATFGHFFASVTNLLAFVNEAAPETRRLLLPLTRASFSNPELALLAYYTQTLTGEGRLLPLVRATGLLADLRDTEVTQQLRAPIGTAAFQVAEQQTLPTSDGRSGSPANPLLSAFK
jgi:hypothetical protein